jgi:hypothetical protein
VDPNNPIVKLCAAGMQAEAEGRDGDARALFMQAWNASSNDYEASIAAHFVARQQASLEETLRWNQAALNHADAVGDERVGDSYPSLYLNLGRCHELLGDQVAARACYGLAAEKLAELPAGSYGDLVRRGVAAALARMG